jgi:hypothetical protein
VVLLVGVSGSGLLQAQNTPPPKQWDKTYGGSLFDYSSSVVAASDGGYLLGGSSASDISGDKSVANRGGIDYWIVKIDREGNKLWDKAYGGNGVDDMRTMITTSDGGYLLGGFSASDISGEKSENGRGEGDCWLVKIDSLGNKLWDKTYGGNGGDVIGSIVSTPDGGYLLGGFSASDISGEKSENGRGEGDYWIVKIDREGNKLWDKTYGGSMGDGLGSMISTPDGGYLLGGTSRSDISGEKSENSRGSDYDADDYWIVKIDSLGNKLWDKTYGGSMGDGLGSMISTLDGGYLLSGFSASDISGEKSESVRGIGDFWLVKIDSVGNKLWDKIYGGGNGEASSSIISTSDGGYLLGGTTDPGYLLGTISDPSSSGDKSEENRGKLDYWIVKIDQAGNQLWDKTLGGSDLDAFEELVATFDGGYLLAGISASGISGDKSEMSRGGYDYWVVKLGPETALSPGQYRINAGGGVHTTVYNQEYQGRRVLPGRNSLYPRDHSGSRYGR